MHSILTWLIKRFKLRKLYLTVFSSIAFLPSAIALAIVLMAFFFMNLDSLGHSYKATNYLSFVVIKNPETARSLLSALATSIISLMVFSFTMVMVVLTMATNNYSPRVLPGLVNNRTHQLVLGLYLGTIAFTLFVLINIDSARYRYGVPELSVLVNTLFVIICFMAFVYFIHSISQHIQIGNILANLFTGSRKALQEELNREFSEIPEGTEGWFVVASLKAGYFQGINESMSLKIAEDYNIQIFVLVENGKFLMEGSPFLKISRQLPGKVVEKLQKQVSYYHQEHVEVNYLYGFKHITEIAVKALSPGINDPGTAIKAVEYLTVLFHDLLQVGKCSVRRDSHDIPRLFYSQASFEEVFYLSFSSIRNYAARDVTLQLTLLRMLHVLESSKLGVVYKTLFEQERMSLLAIVEATSENEKDKAVLRRSVKNMAEDL